MSFSRWPLSLKIWSMFAGLTLVVFGMLAVMLPWLLKEFFTEQVYDILFESQASIQSSALIPAAGAEPNPPAFAAKEGKASETPDRRQSESPKAPERLEGTAPSGQPAKQGTIYVKTESPLWDEQTGEEIPASSIEIEVTPGADKPDTVLLSPDGRQLRILETQGSPEGSPAIRHFVLEGEQSSGASEPGTNEDPVLFEIEQNARSQTEPTGAYTMNLNNQSLLYVIRKQTVEGQPVYLVTYAWGNYRNDLVQAMFTRLMLLMVALLLLSWLPCWILARYLTRPLVQMERHVGRLAERDWHEPIDAGRKDEIGRLAAAIEAMRQRLVRQDQDQQFYLQNISHELKTPVMVIRSYVQSINDGIFPKGNLQGSLAVIAKESERLEKRVRDLLRMNRLRYVTSRADAAGEFPVKPVINDTIERLRYRRTDVAWHVDVAEEATMTGSLEQWRIAFENLLDNQLRHAGRTIHIRNFADRDGRTAIRVGNDGPPIGEALSRGQFEPFRPGPNGEFGLGLTIVRQIARNHGMRLRAVNEPDGVAFYIEPEPADAAG